MAASNRFASVFLTSVFQTSVFRTSVLPLSIGFFAAALALSGCDRAKEKAQEKALEAAIEQAGGKDVEVERKDDQIKISAPDGSGSMTVGMNVALPEDFPKDVWVPANANIIHAVSSKEMANAIMNASQLPPQIAADAAAAMTAAGWQQVDKRENAQGMQQLAFVKNGQRLTYSAHVGRDKASSVLTVRMMPADK
jgi:hypothetical protein